MSTKVAPCPECGKPSPCFVERVLHEQAIDRICGLLVDADNEWFKGVASDDRWRFIADRLYEGLSVPTRITPTSGEKIAFAVEHPDGTVNEYEATRRDKPDGL